MKPSARSQKSPTRGKGAAMARSSGKTGKPGPKAKAAVSTPIQIKSILVPTDFSAASGKAIDYAAALARQFGARLTLLHVVEPIASPDFGNSFPLSMESDAEADACNGRLGRMAKDRGLEPELIEKLLVRNGRSFHEIADAAKSLKVDLIVISTHGYTGIKRALLGSSTERVVRHAPCPVLVVRTREHDFLPGESNTPTKKTK